MTAPSVPPTDFDLASLQDLIIVAKSEYQLSNKESSELRSLVTDQTPRSNGKEQTKPKLTVVQ